MKTITRVYRADVLDQSTGKVISSRLIRTSLPDRASAAVARDLIQVRVATQDDMADLLGAGVKIEVPGAQKGIAAITVPVSVTFAPGAVESMAAGVPPIIEHTKIGQGILGEVGMRILPSEEPAPAISTAMVAETDASGKPTHIVVGA